MSPDENIEFIKTPSLSVAGTLLEITGVSWSHIYHETVAQISVSHGPNSTVERNFSLDFYDARFLDYEPYCSWRTSIVYENITDGVGRSEIRIFEVKNSDLLKHWNSRSLVNSFSALSFDCKQYAVSDGIGVANVLAFGPPQIKEIGHAH